MRVNLNAIFIAFYFICVLVCLNVRLSACVCGVVKKFQNFGYDSQKKMGGQKVTKMGAKTEIPKKMFETKP